MSKEQSVSFAKSIFCLGAITALLAWITYGTSTGVLGALAYLLAGLLNIFPWIIPVVGVPLGIADLFGAFGSGMYGFTLSLAHVESSWLTIVWYTFVVIISGMVSIVVSLAWFRKITRKQSQPKNLALVNCHIIDGSKNNPVIEDGVILIKNIVGEHEKTGRIEAVGRAGELSIPTGYEMIDLKGQYILPGFINAHCHLFNSGAPSKLTPLMSEHEHLFARMFGLLNNPPGKRLMLGRMQANARNALHSGVTTLRTLGDFEYQDVRLRKMIDRGEVVGPRLVVAGKLLSSSGGHGGFIAFTVDSPTEIKRAIRQNLREEVNWIKITSTGGVMDARRVGEAGQPQMTVEEIETACDIAHHAGVMVATHCESTKGMEEALRGGVDTIEHGAEITDEMVALFKNNPKAFRGYTVFTPTIAAPMGLAVLPTSVTQISPMSFENSIIVGRRMIKGLRRALKEGIPVAVGTDASVPYVAHYEFWKEVKYYVHYTGMTPQEAIHMATANNAQVLGIDDETGSIEAGKSADLQVMPGNPLEDMDMLGQVSMVVMRGLLIDKPQVKRLKQLDENPITRLIEVV
jgi:imidazolonepropionase-like amidohydrolase